jgi:protein O-mannosyl-transferase
LERLNAAAIRKLLVEKIPFFLLTAASCVVTYLAQNRGAVKSLAAVPLVYRVENAPVAVATYLLKLIWPANLAVIYPMPQFIAPAAFLVSLLVLVFITVVAWQERKRNPFLIVGWFWFLGTLVPVIGLVKVGDAALADRYMYLPSIGIFMVVAFGAQKLARNLSWLKTLLPAAATFILCALAVTTERQLSFWQSDEALFGHAMAVTTNNVDAILNYGVALENEGKPMPALKQYRRAAQIAPSSYMAHVDLGNLLYYTGDTNAAVQQYEQAIKLNPNSPTLHDRFGSILSASGDFAAATNQLDQAIRLAPNEPAPHLHLGIALANENDFAGATNEFTEAMRLAPGDPSPLVEWAKALLQQSRDVEAIDKLHQALQLSPDDFQTLTFSARVLAADKNGAARDGSVALTLAQKASDLTGGSQPLVEDVLGMACAEAGQFDDAQKAASNAISLATAAGMKPETIAAMQERLGLYQKHEPWRESFTRTKGE